MTKVKMSKEDETASQSGIIFNVFPQTKPHTTPFTDPLAPDFVEKRRAALERYLNRTGCHPSLRVDPDFREFLELDAELPKANQTSTLSGKNVMKLISKVGLPIPFM